MNTKHQSEKGNMYYEPLWEIPRKVELWPNVISNPCKKTAIFMVATWQIVLNPWKWDITNKEQSASIPRIPNSGWTDLRFAFILYLFADQWVGGCNDQRWHRRLCSTRQRRRGLCLYPVGQAKPIHRNSVRSRLRIVHLSPVLCIIVDTEQASKYHTVSLLTGKVWHYKFAPDSGALFRMQALSFLPIPVFTIHILWWGFYGDARAVAPWAPVLNSK